MERIHYIHEEFDSPALIEEYIEGREIYAAILGNYETARCFRWWNSIFPSFPRERRGSPARM